MTGEVRRQEPEVRREKQNNKYGKFYFIPEF
jgi:hypothetical protein